MGCRSSVSVSPVPKKHNNVHVYMADQAFVDDEIQKRVNAFIEERRSVTERPVSAKPSSKSWFRNSYFYTSYKR